MYIKSVLSLRLILKRRVVRVIIIIQQLSLRFLLSMVSFMGKRPFPEEDHEPRWQDPFPGAKTSLTPALCLKVSRVMVSWERYRSWDLWNSSHVGEGSPQRGPCARLTLSWDRWISSVGCIWMGWMHLAEVCLVSFSLHPPALAVLPSSRALGYFSLAGRSNQVSWRGCWGRCSPADPQQPQMKENMICKMQVLY